MSINALPDEILLKILSFLEEDETYTDNSKADFCSAALASRRLSQLVQSLILRHVVFNWNKQKSDTFNLDRPRISRFMKACSESAHLIDLVHSAIIRWRISTNTDDDDSDKQACKDFFTLLLSGNHLSELSVSFTGASIFDLLDLPSMRSLDSLKSLSLSQAEYNPLYVDQVEYLCRLPKLEELMLHTTILPKCSTKRRSTVLTTDTYGQHHDIAVRELKLYTHVQVHPELLDLVLPDATSLTSLHLTIPGASVQTSIPMSAFAIMSGIRLLEPLSPSRICQSLIHVKDTLEKLDISSMNVRFPDHDGSTFDASQFTSLRELKLPSMLLFGNCPHAWQKDYADLVWQRLPTSLTNLKICFTDMQGIFYSLSHMRQSTHQGLTGFNTLWLETAGSEIHAASQLSWLTDIIERKESTFPELDRIDVYEDAYWDEIQCWKIIRWPLNARLAELCETAGVQVDLRVRVPKTMQTDAEVIMAAPEPQISNELHISTRSA